MARDLVFRWQADLVDAVERACASQLAAGRPWFAMPPLLLFGPEGAGRTHVARRIAAAASVPHVVVDAAAFSADAPGARARGPDPLLPSPVVMAMAATRCANPVVTVIGVARAGRAAQDSLAAILNPSRSARVVEPAVGATVDLGQVSWIVQARHGDIADLSPALAGAATRVEMRAPLGRDRDLHLVSVLAEAAADLGLEPPLEGRLVADALDALTSGSDATAVAHAVLLAHSLTSVDRMVETEEGRDLILTYFSYTGSDLGSNREEQELVSLLKDRLAVAIPDMHLHLRNYEHVSMLQSLVRVCQYQSFASSLGQAYLPHDFRGSIINILSRDRVQPAFRLAWERLMDVMSAAIKKEYDEKLAWARPATDESFALWERFEMPTFLAMALGRTDTVDDLFHHVGDIRNRAQDLRHLLEQFTDADTTARGDAIVNDVSRVAHELGSTAPTKAASIFSVSVGLPPSVSLRMNLPSLAARKSQLSPAWRASSQR